MRSRSALKWFFLALAAGPAGAQTTGAPAPLPATGVPAGDAVAGDAQVRFQGKRTLTPGEQVVEGGKHLTRMKGASTGIRKMLEEARRLRDIVKTLCLNDKLSQSDVALRSARDRAVLLQAAANRNDAELSNHEYTILTVLRQRTEQLVAEANQCIGEESAFVGDTKTTATVDPRIADTDPEYPIVPVVGTPPAAEVIGPAVVATPIR